MTWCCCTGDGCRRGKRYAWRCIYRHITRGTAGSRCKASRVGLTTECNQGIKKNGVLRIAGRCEATCALPTRHSSPFMKSTGGRSSMNKLQIQLWSQFVSVATAERKGWHWGMQNPVGRVGTWIANNKRVAMIKIRILGNYRFINKKYLWLYHLSLVSTILKWRETNAECSRGTDDDRNDFAFLIYTLSLRWLRCENLISMIILFLNLIRIKWNLN